MICRIKKPGLSHRRKSLYWVVFVTVAITWIILLSNPALQLKSQDSGFIWETCEALVNNQDSSTPNVTIKHADRHILQSCESMTTFNGRRPWISPEEIQFSIAFAVTVYETPEQFAHFLRMIFRPHNAYCIHIDRKTSKSVTDSLERVAKCFGSNVFLVPPNNRVNVLWGYFSVIEATLLCAELLLHQTVVPNWRYLLNVNSKEFPLRTNWEMVSALQALNGSNLVENVHFREFEQRIPKHKYSFKFTWYKGSLLTALRREFVHFMFSNPHALELLNSMRAERNLRKVQDELLFSTLAYNPQLGAPGACLHPYEVNDSDPQTRYLARYVNWDANHCPSKYAVHSVCIFGVRDVPILIQQPHLLANKFFWDFEPLAYTCMEYWLLKRLQYEKVYQVLHPTFNRSLYANLYCSKMHI